MLNDSVGDKSTGSLHPFPRLIHSYDNFLHESSFHAFLDSLAFKIVRLLELAKQGSQIQESSRSPISSRFL